MFFCPAYKMKTAVKHHEHISVSGRKHCYLQLSSWFVNLANHWPGFGLLFHCKITCLKSNFTGKHKSLLKSLFLNSLTFKLPVDLSAWQSKGWPLLLVWSCFLWTIAVLEGQRPPNSKQEKTKFCCIIKGKPWWSGVKWNGHLGEHININNNYWKVKNYWSMNYDTY